MFFQYPAILLLLWILPVAAWLLVRAERKRAAAARRFVGQPMVPRLMPRLGGTRRWFKGTLVLLSLAMLITAAARPRFGIYFEKVVRRGVDCFVLLDVSRSMLAEDVAPNRLERAKSDVRDLLGKLVSDRVGLIVFAGKPALKVPLTTDDGFFRTVLDEIDVRSAPRGGTLIGDAIRKALAAMPPRADHDQVLVIFTDGEDQDLYSNEAAEQAAERGVKIFTIGLGDSAEGARIPIRDASGNLVYLKDDGKEHWSKADQDVLKQIALATSGAHVPAGTRAYDLGQIYEDHLADLARDEEVQEQKRKRRRDRYQVFLMLAVALFAADMLIPAYPRTSQKCGTAAVVRPISCDVSGATAGLSSSAGNTVGQANRGTRHFASKCVLAGLLLLPVQALASTTDAAREVDKGLDAFRGGDFKAAAAAFSAADRALPDQPLIAFDLGCAYAAEGKHDEAAEQFRAAALAQDGKLAATAHYNLGCIELSKAKTRFGERPEEVAPEVRKEGIATLLQATASFRDSLAVDPQHADARYNLEAVRLWIKHVEEVWRQRDRDRRRKEMNLLQFLQYLEGRQRELRSDGRRFAETPASPMRREAARKIKTEQRYLAEEIEPLKAKVAAALSGPPPQDGSASPAAGAEVQKALALLNNLADEAHGAMHSAADSLAAGKMPQAIASQSASVEKLDQVFMAVAPFVNLVQKAIKTQQGLINQSKEATSTKIESEKGKKDEKVEEAVDWGEAAWNQRFIGGYGRILPAKARRELERLEKAPPAAPSGMTPPNGKAGYAAEAAEKRKKQQEEMKRALKAGVELAPKVEKLSADAAASLVAAKPADALPLQEEALTLLKEMLPRQDQQKNEQDKNKQDQQNKNQQKQDQKNKDKDQQDKDQQRKNQQDKDKEKDKRNKDRQNKDKRQKGQRKQDREKDKTQAQKQQQEKLSKQEAEAVMRMARERRQQRKELEKALLEKLYRPEGVDKDW